MDTLTKSCSPTTVITANREVQTHEEATVYVKELDTFLTMKVLENTPAVFCDENGYSCEWINGQKPHLIKNGIRIQCNTENFVPILTSLSSSSHLLNLKIIISHLLQTHLRHRHQHQVIMRFETERIELKVIPLQCLCQVPMLIMERGNPWSAMNPITSHFTKPTKNFQNKSKGDHDKTGKPVVCQLRSRKFWNPGMVARIQEILEHDEIPRRRNSRQFFSWTIFRAHKQ